MAKKPIICKLCGGWMTTYELKNRGEKTITICNDCGAVLPNDTIRQMHEIKLGS